MLAISTISVSNFRSLKSVTVSLDSTTCLVGHNNSGKSSVLIALSLLLSGERLRDSDFFNKNHDITIRAEIDGFVPEVLDQLHGDSRERIQGIIYDGRLVLVRRYDHSGKSRLRCERRTPADPRFSPSQLTEVLAGARGAQCRERMEAHLPELRDRLEGLTTQGAVREAIDAYVNALPSDQLELSEADLPTGIDASVLPILPEVVYVPAVQDVADALKTKEAASFGKLLRVFADIVSQTDQVRQITESFVTLDRLLNRQHLEDGTHKDERLEEVKSIESSVAGFLQEQFPGIGLELQIPPPEIKTLFQGAQLFLDDGVQTEADLKGDGVKRGLIFSLLRTYVQFRHRQRELEQPEGSAPLPLRQYLFLFEEPELYLHPQAQQVLYQCLAALAEDHQVCVSTHSPYFLQATSTGTFIRLQKEPKAEGDPAPATKACVLNLFDELSHKEAFQLLCYENNSAAFFAERVVLVEGDADQIYIAHLAQTLRGKTFAGENVALVQTGGKGSIERYRRFFGVFEVDVAVVADLDVLVDGFDKLGASTATHEMRGKLLQSADELIKKKGLTAKLTSPQAKRIINDPSWAKRLERAKEICVAAAGGKGCTLDEAAELEELFSKQTDVTRLEAIASFDELADERDALLGVLRREGIHILSRGPIEEYFPDGATGLDKPSVALSACQLTSTREDVAGCGGTVQENGQARHELDLLLECLLPG